MRSLSSIFARVLATATFAACGGNVATIPEGQQNPGASSPTQPEAPKPRGPRDGGTAATSDAGCTTGGEKIAESGCSHIYFHSCGLPKGVDLSDGLDNKECTLLCGPQITPGSPYWGCGVYQEDDLPGPSFHCYTCVEGRRPQGYVEPVMDGTIAGWLAHAADLERVSIDAFQILQRELRAHEAPEDLVLRAAQAEADEVRHARMLATLARREGARPSATPIDAIDIRGLAAIALENAVEGCIRETYGAIVAGWQANHASRKEVRATMTCIYKDETAHSDLAWRVHAWLLPMLTTSERAEVETAMAEAIVELVAAARTSPPPELERELGLPSAAQSTRLVEGLEQLLWLPALAA